MSKAKFWLLAIALVTIGAPMAQAQVGSGWQQYHPSSTIQLDGSDGIETYPGSTTNKKNEGASYARSGNAETFTLFDSVSNRSERRMRNEYTSGRWQFEGEVRVSGPTNDESVMQIFGGSSPATTQMIRAFSAGGGTLRKVPGGVTLATGIYGDWVRLNVIHDVGANVVRTYVNGNLKATGDGEAPSKWYHKYGCYGTLKTPSAKVEWRNVKHFRHTGNDDNDSFDLGEQVLPGELAEPEPPDFGDGGNGTLGETPGFGCAAGGGGGAAGLTVVGLIAGLAMGRARRRRRR